MNTKETLEAIQYIDNVPLTRQCCVCKTWLDEQSEVIVNARPAIEYVISHGLCEPCHENGELK